MKLSNAEVFALWLSILSIVIYSQGYIQSGSYQAAVNLHEEMFHLGLEPDRLTYNTLILACVKSGKLDAAMHFLEEMKVTACLKGQF